MNAQPSLFDYHPTLERRNASYNSLQPSTISNELKVVKDTLSIHKGLTSRQISTITGIERTSVTRILKENEKYFDVTQKIFDESTNRTVTLYRLK